MRRKRMNKVNKQAMLEALIYVVVFIVVGDEGDECLGL